MAALWEDKGALAVCLLVFAAGVALVCWLAAKARAQRRFRQQARAVAAMLAALSLAARDEKEYLDAAERIVVRSGLPPEMLLRQTRDLLAAIARATNDDRRS